MNQRSAARVSGTSITLAIAFSSLVLWARDHPYSPLILFSSVVFAALVTPVLGALFTLPKLETRQYAVNAAIGGAVATAFVGSLAARVGPPPGADSTPAEFFPVVLIFVGGSALIGALIGYVVLMVARR